MAGYRLNKLKENTHVAYWADPRGPGHGHLQRGTIASHIGDTILITWFEGENEGLVERWSSGDLRYRVDRGQIILTPPPKPRRIRRPPSELWCKICGTRRDIGCDCPRPGALKPEHWGNKSVTKVLTLAEQDDSIDLLNDKDEGNPIQKGAKPMAKTKTTKATKVVDDDDFVELDEVEEDEDEEDDPSAGKLSAKEAAVAIGTDARTLRKFLRKKAGKVGQGNRWLIAPDDLDDLKQEFEASTRSTAEADDKEDDEPKPKAKKPKSKSKAKPKRETPIPDEEIYGSDDDEDEDDDEFEVLDEIDDL